MTAHPVSLVFRPFDYSDEDYLARIAIQEAVLPEYPQSLKEWKHFDAVADPKYLVERSMIELDGEVIGFINLREPFWSYRPGKLYFDIVLHPDQQGHGFGRTAYQWLLKQAAKHNPNTLTCGTRENHLAAMHMAQQHGFELALREPVSMLAVEGFSAEKFSTLPAKVAAKGIEICTVYDLQQTDPDWQRNIWNLKYTLLEDVPTDEPYSRQPLEKWIVQQLEHPKFDPRAWIVALDLNAPEQPSYIGVTHMWISKEQRELALTGLTGVKRDYRRMGIATAMKLRSIAYAKQLGIKMIETDNEESNPMYDINMKLGFRPRPAIVHFKKML